MSEILGVILIFAIALFVLLILFLLSLFSFVFSRIMSLLLSGVCILYPFIMTFITESSILTAKESVQVMGLATIAFPICMGLSILYSLGPWLTGGCEQWYWSYNFFSQLWEPMSNYTAEICIAAIIILILMIVVMVINQVWLTVGLLILVILFNIISLIFRDTFEP